MSEFRIASRYAKSLLELAQEKKALSDVLKDVQMLDGIAKSNRDFVLMLKNPIIHSGHKLTILRKLFKGKVHNISMSLFEIVTSKHREMYLPEMAEAFLHLYNVSNGIVESTVTTVAPLSASLRKEVTALLNSLTDNKKVQLTEVVDPEMIGGFVLKIGDKQIDESVSGKLRELKLEFQRG